MTQTMTHEIATTIRRRIAPQRDNRIAFVLQNKSFVAGETIIIANSQTGAGIELDPREKFGRDIFAPTDEMWIEAVAGTPTLLLVEEF